MIARRPGLDRGNPARLVTYADVAQWAGISLAEAEHRFQLPDGPERLRIAGEDCFWEHDARRFLETSSRSAVASPADRATTVN
jgi:hypothetical protein